MDFVKAHKTTVLVIVLIIVGFILYGFFTGGATDEDLLLVSQVSQEQDSVLAGAVGTEILALLSKLPGLDLNGSIFESAEFKGLVDFGQELTPQPVGRPNPFAPIGVGVVSGSITDDDDGGSVGGGQDNGSTVTP